MRRVSAGRRAAPGLAVLLLLASPVAAKDAPTDGKKEPNLRNPVEFLEMMHDLGYRAKLKIEDERPMIESRTEGITFGVNFYNCTKDKDCEIGILTASWPFEGEDKAMEAVNGWNAQQFVGRAWLVESESYIGLDRPLNLMTGYSVAAMESEIDWWAKTMVEFRDYLRKEVYADDDKEKSRETMLRIRAPLN
ncbi:YbjN domain-containing protein [Methylobrevis pamukkalensis]|nr:YbjN domain-containing protein [Methylobrevis pamukkalensis]